MFGVHSYIIYIYIKELLFCMPSSYFIMGSGVRENNIKKNAFVTAAGMRGRERKRHKYL
jgi:CRISPR/Cas system-associated exonuclease Cas4 (RecB family)